MSTHEEGIIREAANAARMARLHGCAINVEIHRWGHTTVVRVTPDGEGELTTIGEDTEVIEVGDTPREQLEDETGEHR
jgi:hypothetical protein